MILGILGPTASGKTSLSIDLSNEINSEIISCDSVAVYKGFDIGSAKPTKEERKKAIFHLVDFVDPQVNYNVGDFAKESHKIIDNLLKNNKIPIISGGSGLYAMAALEGIDELPETTPDIREKVNKLILEDFESCVNKLKEIDLPFAEKLDLKNPRRVSRALEIYYMTKKAPSIVYEECKTKKRPDYKAYCLTMDREELIERINKRVDIMVELGLFEEVKSLIEMGYANTIPMGSIGYREVFDYYNGIYSKDEAIEKIKISTRQFAKRQYTWFRKYLNVEWIHIKDIENLLKKLKAEQ